MTVELEARGVPLRERGLGPEKEREASVRRIIVS